MYIFHDNMKLTYTNVKGYLIPNLTYKSGEQMELLGKYGFLRRDYLKNHRNSLYQVMLLQDSIGEHLLEVDKAAREREEMILKQLEEKDPLPDKEKDQMAWVRAANSHRAIAEEIILKELIGCMVYGKTKIPDPGTGKEVPVPRSEWKILENHHEPIVSKEIFEKAQSLQIRYNKKSKFNKDTTLLSGYVKCGNCRRNLTGSNRVHGHILYSCAYSQGKEDTGFFAGKADDKMLEHMVLAEIKAYLHQNISHEQMQQSMRKQHEDNIEAYKAESTDCGRRQ